jgi:hypothetical protein
MLRDGISGWITPVWSYEASCNNSISHCRFPLGVDDRSVRLLNAAKTKRKKKLNSDE